MKYWYCYEKIVRKVTYGGVFVGGIFLVLMCLLVFSEVVLRTFFNTSTLVADEISSYLLAGGFFLASAYALQEDAIVRIDILYNKIPRKMKCYLDILIDAVVLCYVGILFYHTLNYAYKALVNDALSVSFLKTPLWLPQVFVPIGCLLLFLCLTVLIGRDFLKAIGKITVENELTATEKEVIAQMDMQKESEQ